MINIYFQIKCSSSRKAHRWFNDFGIPINSIPINKISKKEIIRILSLTDQGINGIIKRPVGNYTQTGKEISLIEKLKFNDAIDYLKKHPELLKTPIIIEKNKILIGYNVNEIRKFLPQIYRQHNFKN